ncbi:hypothetical protein [Sorangium sp. So ce388]|uniref:hypothetical protein n=1 Tax=Sorangium sp. So ce388 TaxID=3133309 RepID=UPI003F5B988D
MDQSLHENVRAQLGCSLAVAGLMDEAMAAFASALLRDSNCAWTRMWAAESLGGPWGVPYLDVLVESLRDRKVHYSLWAAYRVADFAFGALSKIPDMRAAKELRQAVAQLEAELHADDEELRALATFALTRQGHRAALHQLRILAHNNEQAEDLLHELDRVENDRALGRI